MIKEANMFGILNPVTADVIDGPAFLYDGDFWWTLICVVAVASILTPIIVLLCIKSAKRRKMRMQTDDGIKDKSGEEK